MSTNDEGRADWQGVGDAFRTLGQRLKGHAVDAGGKISAANEQADGVADQVTSAVKAAVAKLDETSTDPEVAAATKDATARLLDAIKAELTGGPAAPAPAEPEPPKAVEPGEPGEAPEPPDARS
jgi:hypothetical protein